MKGRIIQHFHAGAATYDQAAAMQRISAERLALQLPIKDNLQILEIGCGTGILTNHLLDLYSNSQIYAVDIAPNMVQICKDRFVRHPNIHFACHDMDLVSWPGRFDLIVSNMTLHWLAEGLTNLDSIINNLKPEGELHFTVPGESSFQEWKEACEKNQLKHGILAFPSIVNLQHHYPNGTFYSEINKQRYASAYQFLHSFKQLGTQTSRNDYQSIGAGHLRRVARYLDQAFSNEVEITHEIIYGACKRS